MTQLVFDFLMWVPAYRLSWREDGQVRIVTVPAHGVRLG